MNPLITYKDQRSTAITLESMTTTILKSRRNAQHATVKQRLIPFFKFSCKQNTFPLINVILIITPQTPWPSAPVVHRWSPVTLVLPKNSEHSSVEMTVVLVFINTGLESKPTRIVRDSFISTENDNCTYRFQCVPNQKRWRCRSHVQDRRLGLNKSDQFYL